MATGNIIGTFFEKEEGRTYECNEGDISVDSGYSCINGAKQQFSSLKPLSLQNPFWSLI